VQDYYARLGVARNATPDDIKRAWREQAKQLHPDHNHGSDGTAFKLAAEAWEVLSDPDRRSRYDRDLLAEEARRRPAPTQAPARPSYTVANVPVTYDAWSAAMDVVMRMHEQEATRRYREMEYANEQIRLEQELAAHGYWTRDGTMRDGSHAKQRKP